MKSTAWTVAERAVFTRLLTKCGGVEGKTAFIGHLPPVANAWGLNTGSGPGAEELWSVDPDAVHMDAEIVGRFVKRADAQAFFMNLLTAQVPESTGENLLMNVMQFRIREGGMPEIELDLAPLANAPEQKAWLYTIAIGCELTFACDWTVT
jgi:hypothetical protein